MLTVYSFINYLFLSTHSVRSATGCLRMQNIDGEISIHALRKECDRLQTVYK